MLMDLTDYLEYLSKRKKLSVRTIRNYEFYLRTFLNWCAEQKIKALDKLTMANLETYQVWLSKSKANQKKKTFQKNTQNYFLIALRSFIHFLNYKKITTLSPVSIKLSRTIKPAPILDSTEITKLLSAPMKWEKNPLIRLRDKAILELLYSTGLKIRELGALAKKNYDGYRRRITVAGRYPRSLTLTNQAVAAIEKYLESRKDKTNYLFVAHDRVSENKSDLEQKCLTPRSVERMLERYSKLEKLARAVTPNAFRHTFVSRLITAGSAPEEIHALLGNKSLAATKNYLKAIDKS